MIESIIFKRLITDEKYFTEVIPFLETSYFTSQGTAELARIIRAYSDKYKSQPSWASLNVIVDQMADAGKLPENKYDELVKAIEDAKETDASGDREFMVEQTEDWCQKRALFNALSESVAIKDSSDRGEKRKDGKDIGSIPDLLTEALSVSFNQQVGHDYWSDYLERWERYSEKAEKIPFGFQVLDHITNGGVEPGTLNLLMAQVNVGKSLFLCWLAGEYARQGLNVVHFSMEMSEDAVAQRIDANLLDIPMEQIDEVGKNTFETGMKKAWKDTVGKLIIKRYPTGGANVNHFRAFLQDLRLKKGIEPDVVMVDYAGICSSARVQGSIDNSYGLLKTISEELRGFAVEHDVALWSAAQTNRDGWDKNDIGMGNIAESAGLAATADFILGAITTPELEQQGKLLLKQVKSRYGSKNPPKFTTGVDYAHQRWFGNATLLDHDGNPLRNQLDKNDSGKSPSIGKKSSQQDKAASGGDSMEINWD